MANRPRRPKSGGRPETTIDLGAERIEETAGAGPLDPLADEPVRTGSEPGEASVSAFEPDEAPSQDTADPVSAAAVTGGADRLDTPATGDAISAGDDPSDESRVHEAAAGSPSAHADEVDPAIGEPLPGAAAYETALPGDATDETRGADATVADFAREEGFAAAAPTPRRDLGEFEDDETVLPTTESEASEPDPLATSPYRARHEGETRGAGFGSLLGAALLGAVLAIAGGSLLLYSGLAPAPASQTEPAPTQQYASAGEVQQVTGDLQTLRGAVEQLQSAQAAGGAGSGTVSTADFTQLSDRVAAAERSVQSGGASTGDAAQAAAGATDAANAARDSAGSAETIANGARETAAAAQTVAEGAQTTAQTAQQLAQNAETAANEARQSVDGFGTRLTQIEEANRRAALALSAASLKAAIDRGTPFMPELETFAGAAGDGGGEAVSSLRNFAAAGVPTAASLNAGWEGAETQILAALRPADPTADVGQQVLSGLRSLVTVRPAGSSASPSDPGPEAAVARMDAAVETGDYPAWLGEWNGLPEAAKTASQPYADQVKARVDANGLIDQTINSAVGASASQG